MKPALRRYRMYIGFKMGLGVGIFVGVHAVLIYYLNFVY